MIKTAPLLAFLALLATGCAAELVPYQPHDETIRAFNPSKTCSGEDMISRLARTDPEMMERVQKQAAAVPNGKGKFWRIHGHDVEDSYLFGTVHLRHPEQARLPQNIHHPLASARRVLVESAEQDMDSFLQSWQKASDSKHQNIKKRLQELTVADVLRRDDVPRFSARMRQYSDLPDTVWMQYPASLALVILSEPPCEMAYIDEPLVDVRIEQIARLQGKPAISLDTPESTAALLTEVELVGSEAELRAEILRVIDETDEQYLAMAGLWREGDLGILLALADLMEDAEGLFARAIGTERHDLMMRGIEKHLPRGGNFIAVGAAHLPGEDGLVSRLQRAGYTLTPIL